MPTKKTKRKGRVEYTLPSTEAVHVPTILKAFLEAVHGRAKITSTISECWPELPMEAVSKLASGKYKVKGDSVIVTVP